MANLPTGFRRRSNTDSLCENPRTRAARLIVTSAVPVTARTRSAAGPASLWHARREARPGRQRDCQPDRARI
jgi:hypothetical protein